MPGLHFAASVQIHGDRPPVKIDVNHINTYNIERVCVHTFFHSTHSPLPPKALAYSAHVVKEQHKEACNVFKDLDIRCRCGCFDIAMIFYFWCYLPPTLTAKDRGHAGRVSSSIHVSTVFSSSAVIHNHPRPPRWCSRNTKLQKQQQLLHEQLFRRRSSSTKVFSKRYAIAALESGK